MPNPITIPLSLITESHKRENKSARFGLYLWGYCEKVMIDDGYDVVYVVDGNGKTKYSYSTAEVRKDLIAPLHRAETHE
jgi:hypothetical protein